MRVRDRHLHLDYFREYRLGSTSSIRKNHARLRLEKRSQLFGRPVFYNNDNFGWWNARILEGRSEANLSEGVWPINCWRCERRFGLPGRDIFNVAAGGDVPDSTFLAARQMRRLSYARVHNATEAAQVINSGEEIRFATRVTSEWYNPPDGIIEAPTSDARICGSHSVPLVEINRAHGEMFLFRNSWGSDWGHNGWGAISPELFDQFQIEAWHCGLLGMSPPYESDHGIACLEWKWSVDDHTGVHGRELVDAATSERLGWTFCVRRGKYLDVEEFFVWPTERGKGYASELARMVHDLSAAANLQVRVLVSFADTEREGLENVLAVGRLLGVGFEETDGRCAHLIGHSGSSTQATFSLLRPDRPAFMLEWLRPRDEQPISETIEYSVIYGTNRGCVKDDNGGVRFSNERDEILRTGVARIAIPTTPRFGSSGNAWVRAWRRATGRAPRILDSRLFSEKAEMSEHVADLLGEFEEERHNLMYIHGFRNSFDDALSRAAQLGVDLKVKGATFVYSWPSAGRLASYAVDESSIEAASPQLEEFFDLVLSTTGDTPLTIIVHSMGNRAVLRLLVEWARERKGLDGRLKNLICAAPDVDSEVFKNACDRINGNVGRTVLYANRRDKALQASKWLHGFPRAGLAPPVLTAPGVETVLVEGFNILDLAHGYFSDASSLLHDIFIIVHYDTEAAMRPATLEATNNKGNVFWMLPL